MAQQQQQQINSNYQLPGWSEKPIYHDDEEEEEEEEKEEENKGQRWMLEEIKNGVVVNGHTLDLPVITFGRIPLHLGNGAGCENVDYKSVVIAHESK